MIIYLSKIKLFGWRNNLNFPFFVYVEKRVEIICCDQTDNCSFISDLLDTEIVICKNLCDIFILSSL